MIDKFKELIEHSSKILVTAHISPDPDAVSSVLLMATTLKKNFPDKQIKAVLEEEPARLEFMSGYDSLEFALIDKTLEDFKPQLFILLDGNNYERCSRHDGQAVRDYIKNNGVKTVIIDHHEPDNKDQTDVYINQNSPACVQDVYEVCFDQLGWQQPDGAAATTLTGLYTDSGGFVYVKDGSQKRLFDLVERLFSAGANIEQIKNQLNQYTSDDLRALKELLTNVSEQDDYNYSFLSDGFIDDWLAKGLKYPELQLATGVFLDEFIRNIDGRKWGFITYKNRLQGDDMYSASLRAVGGYKDVAAIATALGGGGHKPAAGAKFQASSDQDAIDKIKAAIAAS